MFEFRAPTRKYKSKRRASVRSWFSNSDLSKANKSLARCSSINSLDYIPSKTASIRNSHTRSWQDLSEIGGKKPPQGLKLIQPPKVPTSGINGIQHVSTSRKKISSPGHDSLGTESLSASDSSGCQTARIRHSCYSSTSSLSAASEDIICPVDVQALINCGLSANEVINAWLTDLGFEDYVDYFTIAGYDIHTISRMTPEDLTAIGIQKPNHRKRLKSEISRLNISDGIPLYIPASLEDWLHLIRLSDYLYQFHAQGYQTITDAMQITVEDLEDVGIFKLGHQKRFLLAVKRMKELQSGKISSVPPPLSTFSRWAPPPPPPSIATASRYEPEVIKIINREEHMPMPMDIIRGTSFDDSQLGLIRHSRPQIPLFGTLPRPKPVAKVMAFTQRPGKEEVQQDTKQIVTTNASVENMPKDVPTQSWAICDKERSDEKRSAGDVLNDIGSMLADLTDELDAMLHTDRKPSNQTDTFQ